MAKFAGPFIIYPGNRTGGASSIRFLSLSDKPSSSASKTNLVIVGAANSSATTIPTITNASFAQASTITIPDPGIASATFALAGANNVPILKAASITAGTVQTRAGATAITTPVVSVTVGNASDGVVLPAAVIGSEISIVNVSNAAGKIYAAGSDTVNLVAGSTGVALTSGSTTGVVTFAVCASAGSWTLK